MSERFPGGIISKTAPVPTGPYETGTAPGIWTLDQQAEFVKQGIWPIAGLTPNYIEDVFSTWLYTGNGSTQTITNGIDLAGEGGLVWIKGRDAVRSNYLFDSAISPKYLVTDTTASATTASPAWLTQTSSGFTIDPTWGSGLNGSGINFASWTFRKQPKFFDVVTWSGDGTGNGRRLAHNLGSVPGCMIFKRTNITSNWGVWHRTFSNPTDDYLTLNTTNAIASFTNNWGTSAPTDTDFPAGYANGSGDTYVAYLFAHDAGGFGLTGEDNVISCGSYTGNGSATGPVVTLGYEPQWLLIKQTNISGANWLMVDTMRGFNQTDDAILYANLSNDEASANYITPLATGFQPQTSGYEVNSNGSTYIYIAIRRGPMKVPTTGTSVFAPATYTGNGANQTFTNTVNNSGSLVVIKGRNSTFPNVWYDQLRGAGNALASNSTSSALQAGATFEVSAFTNKGFSLGENFNYDVNNTGAPFVYWQFVRAPGFFDVVCYTGDGTTGRAVNHNLGVTPELVIVKIRELAGLPWLVWGAPLGTTNALALNETTAPPTYGGFQGGVMTATTFNVAGINTNRNTSTFVAYLFASCPGVSKVGSYTGTAATLQIDCGFTTGARFVLIKRTDSTGDWYVWDSARGIVAGDDPYLLLNTTDAEVTNTDYVDTYSAGFEITSTAPAAINASGGSFIFLAIA